jgi:hypothetical protein
MSGKLHALAPFPPEKDPRVPVEWEVNIFPYNKTN